MYPADARGPMPSCGPPAPPPHAACPKGQYHYPPERISSCFRCQRTAAPAVSTRWRRRVVILNGDGLRSHRAGACADGPRKAPAAARQREQRETRGLGHERQRHRQELHRVKDERSVEQRQRCRRQAGGRGSQPQPAQRDQRSHRCAAEKNLQHDAPVGPRGHRGQVVDPREQKRKQRRLMEDRLRMEAVFDDALRPVPRA